ncbi:MAG: hypothetical protein DRG78_24045 [Epsilonproteobacteria bacterium]|nr:MAG: hypothetical protein DRG78_24045 [Campylobacterota bacterium]
MNKKLNTFTLSGLIVGPVLGSGIILLPPLLYNSIQNYSLIVWLVICVFGFAFALVFGKLAVLFPGDGGVSLATKEALGKKYQLLTSFYLILAVFFGPVAVLLIGALFLEEYFINTNPALIAFGIYIFTYLLLLIRIDFLGKLMLVVTSLITLIFLFSSIYILFQVNEFVFTLPMFDLNEIGYSFLLVFWAIVGWEVIGNYSSDVKNTKTITRAVVFSAIMVSLVYILVASAICFGEFENKNSEVFKLVWLIEPIFQSYSNILLTIISLILCIGTLILFVGGVARLISSLNFTKYSSKHLSSGSPIGALNFLAFIHIITLTFVYFEVFDISNLVAFADGFFIANAIIGLVTAIILFENGFLKYSAYFLVVLFSTILLFSNLLILAIISILFLYTYLKKDTL